MKPRPRTLSTLRWISRHGNTAQFALCFGVVAEAFAHGMPWLAAALLVGMAGVVVHVWGTALAAAELLREVDKLTARMTHAMDQARAALRDEGVE